MLYTKYNKRIWANALALAGFAMAFVWYKLFFMILPKTLHDVKTTDSFSDVGFGMSVFFFYVICLVFLLVFWIISIIENNKIEDLQVEKINNAVKIHSFLIWSGILLYTAPLILITCFLIYLTFRF